MSDSAPDPRTKSPKPVPERFQVAKLTLRFDQFMTHAIKVGGVGIVVAVFGIFVFILSQILPLFQTASVEERAAMKAETGPVGAAAVVGIDEWSELPFTYTGGDRIHFVDLKGDRGAFALELELPEGSEVTAYSFSAGEQVLALGTSRGEVGVARIVYEPEFDEAQNRTITARIEQGEFYEIGVAGAPVRELRYGDSGEEKLFAAVQEADGASQLHVLTLEQKKTLLGAGKIGRGASFDLSGLVEGAPVHLLVTNRADGILVTTSIGVVEYLFRTGEGFELRQQFKPFADLPDPSIGSIDFVFGDVSVVLTSTTGDLEIYSLYRPEGADHRSFGKTKEFPSLSGPAEFCVASQRNKAFLTGRGREAVLCYSTTETVRWRGTLPFTIENAAIDAKFENIVFLDSDGQLHLYALHDPHPEAGWKAFFGKVWYEGASQPDYVWQSTGGSDEFETKLSLTPLLIGSLKGTLYALLFAVPVAVLAAVYTACFLPSSFKRVVKPTMEIMASLPSVVLGFLAALWLAPILETRVPSVMLLCLGVPAAAVGLGWAWGRLPIEKRARLRPGYEFLLLAPMLFGVGWLMWRLGPGLEKLLFVVEDPATGERVADFRLWWPQAMGSSFDQRNSLVVGFMMGFAVVPIVFTIAEDALSNVPPSLVAASSALGASRWQTVSTIVLPIASAGIFSALMIGFGRAVGETMIVVMATGNTPVMDLNIFNGMRTLSANIAVELPEAPVHSTHYRTLFLGAFVLFLLTFALNTVAEILRNHLRNKYKLV